MKISRSIIRSYILNNLVQFDLTGYPFIDNETGISKILCNYAARKRQTVKLDPENRLHISIFDTS